MSYKLNIHLTDHTTLVFVHNNREDAIKGMDTVLKCATFCIMSNPNGRATAIYIAHVVFMEVVEE